MKKVIFIFIVFLSFFFAVNVDAMTFDSTKDKVYLGGETVGLKIKTGVKVTKLYSINDGNKLVKPWSDANLKENDVILEYNEKRILDSKDLLEALNESQDRLVNLKILRDGKEISTQIKPYYYEDTYSLGIFIKDDITGIGTLTYVIPEENIFGALGHKIEGISSGTGKMYDAKVTGIVKSKSGHAGSKKATIESNNIGNIEKITISGVHGKYLGNLCSNELIEIAKKEEIHLGEAQIVTCIDGKHIERFTIKITELEKQNKKDVKGIKFVVTDANLIARTGGIIQGMSGSPIIQDDKLIGAVTHVVVSSPKEGYGIYIEFMFNDMGVDVI